MMTDVRAHTQQRNAASLMLYAHRGSSLLAPENTLPAFDLALSYGADVLEIDVRLSRDGEVIVIHDERVDRTCNGNGRVCDMSLAALKKLNAAYRFTAMEGQSRRFSDTHLITLSELFEHLPQTSINIDIKDNSQDAAQAVARAIEKADRVSSINVGSFHAQALAHFRGALPQATTAATQSEVAQLYFKRSRYRSIPFEYLQIPVKYMGIPLATRSFITHAMQRGVKTVYWTINDKTTMQQLIESGVSGIVTDRVDIASTLLGRNIQRAAGSQQ